MMLKNYNFLSGEFTLSVKLRLKTGGNLKNTNSLEVVVVEGSDIIVSQKIFKLVLRLLTANILL